MTCLTMNRFQVIEGQEAAFEEVWSSRDSHLKTVDGFVAFHLMKGATSGGVTLYASHTLWRDRTAFEAWTRRGELPSGTWSNCGNNRWESRSSRATSGSLISTNICWLWRNLPV